MPTWEEVGIHLGERFRIAAENANWVGLIWQFPDGAEVIRQRQRVELLNALGQPHLMIISDVCPEGLLPSYDMLVHNSTLAVGALAISQGFLIVRHVYSLDALSWSVLDTALEHIAHEAARLRTRLTPAGNVIHPMVAIFDEE